MDNTLFNWLFDFMRELCNIGNWFIQPLPYINISPISLFTISGFNIVIGLHIVHLLNVLGG